MEPFVITPEIGKMIRDWCEKGIDVPAYNPDKELADWALKINACQTVDALGDLFTPGLPEAVQKLFTLRKQAILKAAKTPAS